MDGRRPEPAASELEVDVVSIAELLTRRGLDEGQADQVAGRWVEAGFEDPQEIERLLDEGVTEPEAAAARTRANPAAAGDRHAEEQEPRDVVRGTTRARSTPGDDLEQEPQQPGSPP